MAQKATESVQPLYAVREYLHGKIECRYFEWEYQAVNYKSQLAEKRLSLLKLVIETINQTFHDSLKDCGYTFCKNISPDSLSIPTCPPKCPDDLSDEGLAKLEGRSTRKTTRITLFMPLLVRSTANGHQPTPKGVVQKFSKCA